MVKNVYIISPNGSIIKFTEDEYNEMLPEDMKKLYEEIGNKFEKKSDAKLVVEKLKALKRLENKGFRFVGITETSLGIDCAEFEIGKDFYKELSVRNSELNKDLNLLFGDEK